MLTQLPIEIIGKILELLSRQDISRITVTCRTLYNKTVPSLYGHLELGHHVHMRQLQQGIVTNPSLKQTILSHTRQLTLRSRQNGNNWRIQDLKSILGPSSRITTLIFSDFHALSTDMIQHTVSILPKLQHVQFKYCHLVYNPKQTLLSNRRQCLGLKNTTTFNNDLVNQVAFVWTDFTQKSILFSLFPKITRLELGSNHNKYDTINGFMVQSLYENCPHITHLTITLPQVSSSILCNTISKYGAQLQHLSIRCDNASTLKAIATYATDIRSLIIRVTSEDEDLDNSMITLIKNCSALQRFEIVSCQLENHVPSIVWKSVGGEMAQQMLRKRETSSHTPSYRAFGQGNIWFYIVSEEALQQRHNYINSLTESKKARDLQTLVLTDDILTKTRLLSPRPDVIFQDLMISKK
ncbi:hypothetical protein INT47_000839 [Mucor saturninus]|uniref:F-box domain-containing protein n=1 Tax=Mucor saturninus TaxID=64648 RepID=A0A8H7VF82_9FUNG|nr:hypothetical protein INT47_000839 [Mucor saturninus]